jgi:hypothetical protein
MITLWCGFATSAGVLIGVLSMAYRMFLKDPVANPMEETPWEGAMLIFGALMALSQLAAMFRLFYGNRLIAAVFACMVCFQWVIMAGHGWSVFAHSQGYLTPRRPDSLPMSWQLIAYSVWIMLVGIALPLLVSYLGFCRTRLLEAMERTRGAVSLVIFLLLIVWGSFLILTVPSQLFTMLFVR